MTTQHTPGPWKLYDADSLTPHVGTISKKEKAGWLYETVCNMYEDMSDNYSTDNEYQLFDNAQANARLIAAAPDLLEALKKLVSVAIGTEHGREFKHQVDIGIASIAKATGE